MKYLIALLLCGASAGVCLAQPVEPAAPPAPAPAAAALATPEPPAEPAPAAEPAPPSPAQAAPSGPVVGYAGSKTKVMTAMTAGKAVFGMLGAAAMIAEGKQIIADNHIVDPSEAIAHDTAAEVAKATQGHVADAPLALERGGLALPKPEVLAGAAGGATYVVDVDSGWQFLYFPTDWSHYRVGFLSRMRVIDTAKKKVVTNHFCNWDSDKQGEPKKTHEELLVNEAEGLKAALGRGADFCRKEFAAEVAKTLGATTTTASP